MNTRTKEPRSDLSAGVCALHLDDRPVHRRKSTLALSLAGVALFVVPQPGCGSFQRPPQSAQSSHSLAVADAEGTGGPSTGASPDDRADRPSVEPDDIVFGPERCIPESPYTSFTFRYDSSDLPGAILRVAPAALEATVSAQISLNGQPVLSAKDFGSGPTVVERGVRLAQQNVLVVVLEPPSGGVVVSLLRAPVQLGRVSLSQDWLPVGAEHVLDVSVTASISVSEPMPVLTLTKTDSQGVPLSNEGEFVLGGSELGASGRRSCMFRLSKSFRPEAKGLLHFQVQATSSQGQATTEIFDVEVLAPQLASDWTEQKRFERAMLAEFRRLSTDIGPRLASERVLSSVRSSSLVQSATLGDGGSTISIDYKSGAIGLLRLIHEQ